MGVHWKPVSERVHNTYSQTSRTSELTRLVTIVIITPMVCTVLQCIYLIDRWWLYNDSHRVFNCLNFSHRYSIIFSIWLGSNLKFGFQIKYFYCIWRIEICSPAQRSKLNRFSETIKITVKTLQSLLYILRSKTKPEG